MRNAFVGLAIGLLAGCASSSQTYGTDGKPAVVLNCSGWARMWGMCYEKAGKSAGRAVIACSARAATAVRLRCARRLQYRQDRR